MADGTPRIEHEPAAAGGPVHGERDETDDYRRLEPEDLPGIHRIVVGSIVAVLAPLFGFLGGSVVGAEGSGNSLAPLYYWLVGGIILGGIGAIVAIMGGLRLVRSRNERRPAVAPAADRTDGEPGAELGGTPAR